jgi:hypothetical protein
MRYVIPCVGLACLLALTGCNLLGPGRLGPDRNPTPDGPIPRVADLVKYLEDNAEKVRSLRCEEMDLSVGVGMFPSVSMSGMMASQRPRSFRMKASLLGNEQVDLGSNDQEFWYFIPKADKNQYYCPYQALNEPGRRIQLPIPIQPDWVMETLGMGSYGPPEKYHLKVEPNRFKLIQSTTNPMGKSVKKVIVFHRWQQKGSSPQVTDFLLIDAETNKEICSAHIREVQSVPGTPGTPGSPGSGVVPRRMEINYPAEKLRMKLHFARVTINPQLSDVTFRRTVSPNLPSYNMATRQFDGQLSSLQPAGGYYRTR